MVNEKNNNKKEDNKKEDNKKVIIDPIMNDIVEINSPPKRMTIEEKQAEYKKIRDKIKAKRESKRIPDKYMIYKMEHPGTGEYHIGIEKYRPNKGGKRDKMNKIYRGGERKKLIYTVISAHADMTSAGEAFNVYLKENNILDSKNNLNEGLIVVEERQNTKDDKEKVEKEKVQRVKKRIFNDATKRINTDPVVIDDVEYDSPIEASISLGIPTGQLMKKIKQKGKI